MSRQYDDAMIGRFDIYGIEYELIEPSNYSELIQALSVKAVLKRYLDGLMHDENPNGYDELLQTQEDLIEEYVNSIEEFDYSQLANNISINLKMMNMRMGDFEDLIGVSSGYISRATGSNAKKKLSIDVVWKIAKLFGVDIRTLIEDNIEIVGSNVEVISKFLKKLCVQTKNNTIRWKNLGGLTSCLDKPMLSTGAFVQSEKETIFHKEGRLNSSKKLILMEDIYSCSSIVEGKEFTFIVYKESTIKPIVGFDFYFLNPKNNGMFVLEKAFSSVDDIYDVIIKDAVALMNAIRDKELDSTLTPEVRSIIDKYLLD